MKSRNQFSIFLGAAAIGLAGATAALAEATTSTVTYRDHGPRLQGRLCQPAGPGPFAAVIYNHGGLGTIIGGAPGPTCKALAAAGYIGFAPIRRQTRPLDGHLDDVEAAIDFIRARPFVDAARIGLIGFSRGGMLTFQAATRQRALKAVVIMATAPPRGPMAASLADAANIAAPVLLQVAENDTGSRRTRGHDTLAGMHKLEALLSDAGVANELIIYPSFGNDGHAMFFEIGHYWRDVTAFLDQHL